MNIKTMKILSGVGAVAASAVFEVALLSYIQAPVYLWALWLLYIVMASLAMIASVIFATFEVVNKLLEELKQE